jgi:D-alanine transaminase
MLDNRTVYLNGQWLPLDQAKVSVLDRGFIFGDGIYEVVPVYGRKPFRFEQHLDRMERSCAKLRLTNPLTRQAWKDVVQQLIASLPDADQFVYWQITRGVAPRDFGFPEGATPTVFAMTSPFKPVPQRQREQGLKCVKLPDIRWLKCDIKAVALLGAVLSKQESLDSGADDCIMFRDGWLTESSSANVWIVKGGIVHVPPKDNLILEGIRYGFIEELCKIEAVPFAVKRLSEADVDAADEILLTSATREIVAVSQLNDKPVGSGKPGPVYDKLYAAFQRVRDASRA